MKMRVRSLVFTASILVLAGLGMVWFMYPNHNNIARVYTIADFPHAQNSQEGVTRLVERLNAAFLSLRERNPDDDEYTLWINVGNLKVGLGDFKGAQAAYKKAISLDSTRPLAYLNMGTVYKQHLKDFPRAEEYYNQALERINSPFFSDYELVADLYVTYWPERVYDVEALLLRGADKVAPAARLPYYDYLYKYFATRDASKQELYKQKILELDPAYEFSV